MNYEIYDYSKIDEVAFANGFSNLDWADLDNSDIDWNNKFNLFLRKTSDFIIHNVPHRKPSKKQNFGLIMIFKRLNIVINFSDKCLNLVTSKPSNYI